jgi:fibronectin type 3 domain-containing protein
VIFFSPKRRPPGNAGFEFRVSIFVILLAGGCGAPGEPVPPSPPVAMAVSDLAAHQAGDGVELLFTLPSKSVSGEKLSAVPAVEIVRGSLKPNGSADSKSFRVVYTIPGALVSNYLASGHVRFTDPVSPDETKAHPGATYAYLIRTRLSKKRASADSNIVTARVLPVPQPISSVQFQVTETAVNLTWPAPTQTSAGDPLSAVSGFRVYRGEIDPHASAPTSKDTSNTHWIAPLALLGPSAANSYSDSQFDFGKSYVYVVRSVIAVDGNEIESDNSEPITVTPLDTFPPAAPQGLVAAVLPGNAPATFVVDLSWSINLETDLAGYRVYRAEQEGARGQSITPDLLPVPAIRDSSVQPGHRYWYIVTAVDRAGNESPPSSPVAVDIPPPPS